MEHFFNKNFAEFSGKHDFLELLTTNLGGITESERFLFHN